MNNILFETMIFNSCEVALKVHATRCLFHMGKILSISLSRGRYRI